MNFNIFNSIILAGVIQGLLFGALVFMSKRYKNKSVYFLTMVIIVYSLSNLQFYLNDIGVITYDELFRYFFIPWGNTVPALLYLYVVNYLDEKHKHSSKSYLLFVPFLISLILSLVYKIGKAYQFKNDWIDGLKIYLEGYDELLAALFHIVILSILLLKIYNYKKRTPNFSTETITFHVNWIRNTFIVMLTLVVLWITLVLLYMLNYSEISFYPFWIAMAILIYWFGHIGIYKYGIVEQRKQIRRKKLLKPESTSKVKTKHIIIERLKHFLVNEKQFLDATLTLEKTAEALELSQGHLSKIINTELGISFKDFINSLRVEEAKSYLRDDDFSNYTLVAIEFEAGFNSKSAFNSSFKKITGETPSQFKKRHTN